MSILLTEIFPLFVCIKITKIGISRIRKIVIPGNEAITLIECFCRIPDSDQIRKTTISNHFLYSFDRLKRTISFLQTNTGLLSNLFFDLVIIIDLCARIIRKESHILYLQRCIGIGCTRISQTRIRNGWVFYLINGSSRCVRRRILCHWFFSCFRRFFGRR